jgi:integrase
LTDSQRDVLATECTSAGLWLRAMYEVGCTYGWRVSEIQGLRVRHIDIVARTIRLDPCSTKNGRGRCVTFGANSALGQLLTACVHGKSAEDFVFTRSDGNPVRVFRTTWKNVCTRAGVPGLLFHDLRRTAARDLRRAGVTENVTMAIGGWRTRSMFDRYAIVTEDDITDAVRKLETDRKEREAVAAEKKQQKQESETQVRAQNGHNDEFCAKPTASQALN